MIASERSGGFAPAWIVAAIYAVALLCIPTRLIVGPIGAPGTPANLIAIAALFWWMCAVAGGLNQVRGLTPLRLAAGAFVASIMLSYAWGHRSGWAQPTDIHQRSDRLWEEANVQQVTETVVSAADRGLLAVAGWAGILLLTSEGIRTWAQLDRLVAWLVRAGTFVALAGIVQYFTGLNVAAFLRIPGLATLIDFGNALARSDLNRIVATSSHPIELGVVMASLMPLAVHRALHARRHRLIAWLAPAAIGTAALMSVSRSAVLVGAMAVLVLFLGWPWKWRLIAVVAAPVLALAGRSALPGLLGSIRSLFTGLSSDPSVQGRSDDYPFVMRLVDEHPVLGQGFNTFVPMIYRTIDNQVLVLLLEIGYVGTVAFFALIATGLLLAMAPRRRGLPREQWHLGLAVAASLAGIIVSYFTFDALAFRQVAGLSFLYLGLSGAVWWLSRTDLSAAPSPGSSRVDAAASPRRRDATPSR